MNTKGEYDLLLRWLKYKNILFGSVFNTASPNLQKVWPLEETNAESFLISLSSGYKFESN